MQASALENGHLRQEEASRVAVATGAVAEPRQEPRVVAPEAQLQEATAAPTGRAASGMTELGPVSEVVHPRKEPEMGSHPHQGVADEVIQGARDHVQLERTQSALEAPVQEAAAEFEGGAVKTDKDAVYVAKNFQFKKGQQITEDLIIDDALASGVQAIVYNLKDKQGQAAKYVLKVAKTVPWISNLKREWEAGKTINALSLEDGTLVGFMKMGKPVKEMGTNKYKGLLMEKLSGRDITKVIIPDKRFCDIHYVREMLLQVFVALDEAQRAFGFHHADLRLANVFETIPDNPSTAPEPVDLIYSMSGRKYKPEANSLSEKPLFKIIDYGLARFDEALSADPETAAEIGLGSENLASSKKMKAPKLKNIPRDLVKSVVNAPELVHQTAWKRKGDVYHVLFDLAVFIDGRIWPLSDKVDVELLLALIYHVTGLRLRAYFVPDDQEPDRSSYFCSCCILQGGMFYSFRQAVIRFFGWLRYYNSGISAAEALTKPFFRVREVVSDRRSRAYYRRASAASNKGVAGTAQHVNQTPAGDTHYARD